MSFSAKLIVDDIEGPNPDDEGLNILKCKFEFHQPTNLLNGLKEGRLQAGLINVDIESSRDSAFYQWMIFGQFRNGKIVFNSRELEMSRDKTLNFTQAHIVDYFETFDAANTNPMVTHLAIFARGITIDDSEDGWAIDWTEEDPYE